MIDNPQAAEGDELPFLVTAELRVGEREDQQRNISIKVINLIEKDKVPIKVEDTSDERDQSKEEDREIETPKAKSTVILRPNESKKIPELKYNKFKKSPSPKKPLTTDEIAKERANKDGFRYMWFKNIPTTVEDFKEKEKTWYGFEKALKVLGLDIKKVLARLKKGKPAYENLRDQSLRCQIRCQKAYVEYSREPNAEIEEEPKPRTVRLKEKTKVILKGKPTKQEKEPTEGNRATSSNPCKELEELV